jgi:hypothetical protein
MDYGLFITIAVAIVAGVFICLVLVRQVHHRLSAKLEPSKNDTEH